MKRLHLHIYRERKCKRRSRVNFLCWPYPIEVAKSKATASDNQ
ncbi:hypothetical protein OIU78_025919 [Salix suchowensis]|nr:hypothetical protein OIU78_025919 [Salix suchowensis]